MDNIHRSDFSKICRICLKLKRDMSQLYNTELISKLYESIGVKILESNDLPNSICKECTENINTAFILKQLCTYSQQILDNIIKTEKIENDYENSEKFGNEATIVEDTVKYEPKVETDDDDDHVTDVENFDVNDTELLNADATRKNKKTKRSSGSSSMYKCNECGKYFPHLSKFKRHKIMHIPKNQRRLYHCTTCDKTYFREDTFLKHQKLSHGSNPQPKKSSVCHLCGKSVVELKNHMRLVHSNNKPHQCSQCDKKFAYRHYLIVHIRRVHDGIKQDKPNLCTECGKSFYTSIDLKSHQLHHLGQKPFKCTLCGEEFRWRGGLRGHMKKHNDRERTHACTECDKKFFCLPMLKSHMRIHTGERPYLCKICQKSFRQTGSLSNHMKTHNILQKIKA